MAALPQNITVMTDDQQPQPTGANIKVGLGAEMRMEDVSCPKSVSAMLHGECAATGT